MTAAGFWGLLIEPGKMYSQDVPATFEVIMAALGPGIDDTAASGRTTVMLRIEDRDDYSICSLTPGKLEQQQLKLVLTEGETIGFRVDGPCPVYLTGRYLQQPVGADSDDSIDGSEAEEFEGEYDSEDESQFDSEEAQETVKKIMKEKRKRRAAAIAESESEESMSDDGMFDSEDESAGESTGSVDSEDLSEIDTEDMEDMSEEDFIDDSEVVTSDEDVSEDEEVIPQGKKSNVSEPKSKKHEPEVKKPKVDVVSEKKVADKKSSDKKIEKAAEGKKEESVESVKPKSEEKKISENKTTENNTPNKQQNVPSKPTPTASTVQPEGSTKKPITKTIPSGLMMEDLVVGTGKKVTKDLRVGISYVGKLQSGKVFDKSKGNDLLYFTVGRGEVVKGMDIGVQGMAVGGKRRLTIPAPMAYGNQALPGIPANSTLVFDVSVEKVSPVKNK